MDSRVGFALLLSALAGLSTTIGSLLSLLVRKPGPKFMAISLGFSGGVMILVSFVELLQAGIESIGFTPAHIAFFGGMVVMFIIDQLIPHEYLAEHQHPNAGIGHERLLKTGLFVALGIGIHNLPEGMVSFVAALKDPSLGIAIAVAIALHNIPEGISIAMPIYAATGSRRKAFLWSFLAGVAEPIGAALAAIVLLPFLNQTVLGYLLAAVAGIMVFISLDELIPVSRSLSEEHISIVGILVGMIVMALSLGILR